MSQRTETIRGVGVDRENCVSEGGVAYVMFKPGAVKKYPEVIVRACAVLERGGVGVQWIPVWLRRRTVERLYGDRIEPGWKDDLMNYLTSDLCLLAVCPGNGDSRKTLQVLKDVKQISREGDKLRYNGSVYANSIHCPDSLEDAEHELRNVLVRDCVELEQAPELLKIEI